MSLRYWQRNCARHGCAVRRQVTLVDSGVHCGVRAGFTLIEVLAATALALLMMATVVSMFAIIGDSVSGSRATVEMTDRLRATQLMLQHDLEGVTGGKIAPSRNPAEGLGYFEYIEGPIGPVIPAFGLAEFKNYGDGTLNSGDEYAAAITDEGTPDTTVGDFDDVVMFTTRSRDEPFIGRADTRWAPSATVESQVAEVCWFMRGSTLYRRQLLVLPSLERALAKWLANMTDRQVDKALANFYALNDLSVHMEGGPLDTRAPAAKPPRPTLVLNTLGDLTKREYRYGHQPFAFPHDARFWGVLGMPTLRDCCIGMNQGSYVWPFPFVPAGNSQLFSDNLTGTPPLQRTIVAPADIPTGKIVPTARREVWHVMYEQSPQPGHAYARNFWAENDPALSTIMKNWNIPNSSKYLNQTVRVSDDIIMTNVVSFDVKVWDPGAPIYQTTNDSNVSVAIMPGDVGYATALQYDMGDRNSNNQPMSGLGPISYGAFVDLNYMAMTKRGVLPGVNFRMPYYRPPTQSPPAPFPDFHHAGDRASFLRGTRPSYVRSRSLQFDSLKASVYCTWSTHYEQDGLNQDSDGSNVIDQQTNGLDDPSPDPISNVAGYRNGADDATEREVPPPYDAPVKAVQVKIRVFEPDSEQIREVTVEQNY